MKLFLFLFVYLIGATVGIISSVRYFRENGELDLEDLLLCILIVLTSWAGIVFLLLWHVCEIIARSAGNPVIWSRED